MPSRHGRSSWSTPLANSSASAISPNVFRSLPHLWLCGFHRNFPLPPLSRSHVGRRLSPRQPQGHGADAGLRVCRSGRLRDLHPVRPLSPFPQSGSPLHSRSLKSVAALNHSYYDLREFDSEIRAISSVVERLLHTQEVAGSNPASRIVSGCVIGGDIEGCIETDPVSLRVPGPGLEMRFVPPGATERRPASNLIRVRPGHVG